MSTEVAETIAQVRAATAKARQAGRSIGCVPTMGALHAGHAALMDQARATCDVVAVTIFVNPIQFDRQEDYERYARTLPADVEFCRERNVDVIFAPSADEMYPEPSRTFIEAPDLSRYLCGAFRPGHFRGVATVVAKLFHIVQPDVAFFGEKDAQQLAIIRQMVRDLNIPVRIVSVPTVREADGLALSSRNQRLTPEERQAAPALFRALSEGQRAIAAGERDPAKVKRVALDVLESEPALRLEYLEVADACRMEPVDWISRDVRLAAAVWLGSTRLIDNVLCVVGAGRG
jgi:pantoate--beta-alanine ligase